MNYFQQKNNIVLTDDPEPELDVEGARPETKELYRIPSFFCAEGWGPRTGVGDGASCGSLSSNGIGGCGIARPFVNFAILFANAVSR